MGTCGKHQRSSNTILETNFLESLYITNLGDYAGFFKIVSRQIILFA